MRHKDKYKARLPTGATRSLLVRPVKKIFNQMLNQLEILHCPLKKMQNKKILGPEKVFFIWKRDKTLF